MSDPLVNVIVDCSKAGPPDPAIAAAFQKAALTAIENGDLQKAAALMQDAKDVLDASVVTTFEEVPLTKSELADFNALQQAAVDSEAAARQEQLAALVALCDRYLAQTDWILVPAAARPVDMSPSLAQACDDNVQAWTDWRSQVKAIRDAAVAGPADPDAPGFPDQPAAPAVALT